MTRLNLVVLRSSEPEKLSRFYTSLGLHFVKHRHGAGPVHFAAEDVGGVFEIYPVTETAGSTRDVRVGFSVDNIASAIREVEIAGGTILTPPAMSHWGIRAVVKDTEGHKVELVEKT